MRVLLSAYGCEPNSGSEPGVGWNWAMELHQRGLDVVVLTRANNRRRIEAHYAKAPSASRPEFIYYDLPSPWLYLKSKRLLPLLIYYFFWQLFCVSVAKAAAKRRPFDLVWHITFATIRWPTFLWRLGAPLVFGPAGGGERAPMRLRGKVLSTWLRELMRDIVILTGRVDPLLRLTFQKAFVIFATTEDSARRVPTKYARKLRTWLSIGVVPDGAVEPRPRAINAKLLYAGNLLQWKGVQMAMRALAMLRDRGRAARLTVLGSGPERARLGSLAKRLNVDDLIEWIPWVDHSEIYKVYQSHDILVFPSLHDSGGLVVIEAMQQAMPVVCLNLGGPAQTASGAGVVIAHDGESEEQVSEKIADALQRLLDRPEEYERVSSAVLARASEYSWSARVSGALDQVNAALARRSS